jgi:spore maturation protein B
MLNKYIIPVVVIFVIGYAYKRKLDLYDSFIEGAKDGLKTVVSIIPSIFAVIMAVNIFVKSGVLESVFSYFNADLLTLAVLRPISGNGALAMLTNIFQKYGPDSFYGLVGSVMQGATDTTIYILALYFSSVHVKDSRYALWVGLFADLCGIVAAFVVVKCIF